MIFIKIIKANTDKKGVSLFLYIYDEANSLLAAGDASYYYDNNGNLIFKIDENGNGTEYQYNADNKMVAVYFEDGTDLNYAYEGTEGKSYERKPTGKRKQLSLAITVRLKEKVKVKVKRKQKEPLPALN